MGYSADLTEERPGIGGRIIEIGVALVIGLIALIAGIAALSFLFSQSRAANAPAPPPQPAFDVQTAREAYLPAVDLIRQEDLGALLADGVGAWTPVLDPTYLGAGRTGWTFHFYLPATGQMATIIVDRGGRARITELLAWETAPALLDDQNWQVDSGQAVSLFLGNCQAALDQNPDLHVQARLSTAASNGRLLWEISAVTGDGQVVCQVNVDASTGQVR